MGQGLDCSRIRLNRDVYNLSLWMSAYVYVYLCIHFSSRQKHAVCVRCTRVREYSYSSKNFAPTLLLLQQKNRENKARVVVYSAHIQQEHPHLSLLGQIECR